MALQEILTKAFSAQKDTASSLQKQAFEQFEKEGFPTKKLENWKYTSLNALVKQEYTLGVSPQDKSVSKETLAQYTIANLKSIRIVFVNGVWQKELSEWSSTSQQEGLTILPLQEALQQDTKAQEYYNNILKKDSLTALNTALCSNGVYVSVAKNTTIDTPIELLYFSSDDTTQQALFTQIRNLVVVEDNASIKIIEKHQNTGDLPSVTNSITEGSVGKNARLSIYKIQDDSTQASLVDHTHITQERDSIAKVQTFCFSGKIVRNNLNFYQKGSNIDSILNGLTLIKGKTHVDHNTLVDHAAPNSESHQDYKGIFCEKATGVFNGKIVVAQAAQKTNAFQSSNNLILDDTAQVNSKPQLEIFADDVKCSHGCTIGQLDKDALFYLQSRGIPLQEAKMFLVHAFANDVLEQVEIPAVKEVLSQRIAQQLVTS